MGLPVSLHQRLPLHPVGASVCVIGRMNRCGDTPSAAWEPGGLHYHNIRPLNDLRVVPEYRSPTAGLAVTTGQRDGAVPVERVVSVASSPSRYCLGRFDVSGS